MLATLAAIGADPAGAVDPGLPDGAPRPLETTDGLGLDEDGFVVPDPEPRLDSMAMLAAEATREGTTRVMVVSDAPDPSAAVDSTLDGTEHTMGVSAGDLVAVEVTAEGLDALHASPHVTEIAPDRELALATSQSTAHIGSTIANSGGFTGSGRRIVVIDSGIDGDHDSFIGAFDTPRRDACFVSDAAMDPCPDTSGDGDPSREVGAGAAEACSVEPQCSHGTHVAAIAAGRLDDGRHGVAPGATIIPIRIFHGTSVGSTARASDLYAALNYVLSLDQSGVEIDAVNLSLALSDPSAPVLFSTECDTAGTDFQLFAAMFAQLRARNVAVVVASGNDSSSAGISFPACLSDAIPVTATLHTSDQVWNGSNTAPIVALGAPGEGINSATNGNNFATYSGTSMAAPHVAGAIALLQQRYPGKSVSWMEERLWDTGVHVTDPTNGLQLRRIDVAAATGLRAVQPAPPNDTMWLVTNQGRIVPKGWALGASSLPPLQWGEVIVAGSATRSGMGFWLVSNWGRVFNYGDAAHYGDRAGQALNQPITAMATTSSGKGYWLLGADGGIFAYGDAGFYGSTGSLHLNAPVTDMTATPAGNGYWFTAQDGGVFSYGDAGFYGSTGSMTLNQPVVSIAAGPTKGYWLVARDGGVFAFSVPFHGSLPGIGVSQTGHRVRDTAGGRGYYITTLQGGAYAFGEATDFGGTGPLGAWETSVDLMLPAD